MILKWLSGEILKMFTRRSPAESRYLPQLQLQSPPLAKAAALRRAADFWEDQVNDRDFAESAGFFVTCGNLWGLFFMAFSQEKGSSRQLIQFFLFWFRYR